VSAETRDDDSDDEVVGWNAECREYLDLLKPRTGDRIGSVNADGYGSDTDQETAWGDALINAADQIIGGFAPQGAYEFMPLDEDAPLVREGMAKIDHHDDNGALALWENALTTSPNSAPLLYNLGALCEALHDSKAALAYYSRAIAIAPQVERYQKALEQLNQRRADAEEAVINPAVEDARKSVAVKERAAEMAEAAVTMCGIPYVPIPAGTFTMGCTKADIDCAKNESPAHVVTIGKSFYLAQTPVTNEQYQRCIDAGVCHGETDLTKKLNPVVRVTWNDARDFCTWSGGRLPTEAEWEYAARGGIEGWRFPWGNSEGQGNANLADNEGRRVNALGLEQTSAMVSYPFAGRSPVGTFAPNGFALFDMTGNVSQWTADWNDDYTRRGTAGARRARRFVGRYGRRRARLRPLQRAAGVFAKHHRLPLRDQPHSRSSSLMSSQASATDEPSVRTIARSRKASLNRARSYRRTDGFRVGRRAVQSLPKTSARMTMSTINTTTIAAAQRHPRMTGGSVVPPTALSSRSVTATSVAAPAVRK
jgi:formylglycine-generating enzyme required for sulfatase activity